MTRVDWYWILLGALAVAVILVITVVGTASAPQPLCMGAEDREAARELMLKGVDQALTQHTMHLYDNLLKDRGAEPDRMTRGMHNAVALYLRSRASLQKWSPPNC